MRYGPLHSTTGRLLIGDPTRRHLALTPDGIALHDGGRERERLPWPAIEQVRLHMPTTRWRYPGLVAGVGGALLALTFGDDPGVHVDDAELEIVAAGERRRLLLSRHHAGRYWTGTVSAAQALLDRFVADPAARPLLAHPDEVVRRARASRSPIRFAR